MARFAALTGRHYKLFKYEAAPDAVGQAHRARKRYGPFPRIYREGSAFRLEPHRLPTNRKAGLSRRDISGLFRLRFTESCLDLIRFYAGRGIAGLNSALRFRHPSFRGGLS